MSQENKWKIENLIENLKNNKDAVVIVGDKAIQELNLYKIDENSKSHLNRKKMVKEPKNFWNFYKENILSNDNQSKAEQEINQLINTGVIKTVIDLNYTGNIKVPVLSKVQPIALKGDKDMVRCMSCDSYYKLTNDMLTTALDGTMLKCECKGKIAPSITMFGEKYLEKHTKAIKEAIFTEVDDEVKLNTHCLIFVGVDFEEDYMHELIESYCAIKSKVSTDEEPFFLVMITEKDGVSVEYYQPEFATYEDIAGSINRLVKML